MGTVWYWSRCDLSEGESLHWMHYCRPISHSQVAALDPVCCFHLLATAPCAPFPVCNVKSKLCRPAAWSVSFRWWWLQSVAPQLQSFAPGFPPSPLKTHSLWRNWEKGSNRADPWLCLFVDLCGRDQEKQLTGRVGSILYWQDLCLEFLLLQSSQRQCVLLSFQAFPFHKCLLPPCTPDMERLSKSPKRRWPAVPGLQH